MYRMNRNQTRARGRRAEAEARRREKEEAEHRESLQWEIAEGPIPEPMWKESNVIASFARLPDGICTKHVREHTNGATYLQYIDFPGWRFAVCLRKGA